MTVAVAPSRCTQLRVRYADTDGMGVAYYANHLVWFEVGRSEWLRRGGRSYADMEKAGVSLPVLEAHCEYRRPARYDDELEVAARPSLATPARLRFDYEIRRCRDQTLIAHGHTIHAAVDRHGRPRRLPDYVREMVA
jgi:acyl-CoA thioester hydrolase